MSPHSSKPATWKQMNGWTELNETQTYRNSVSVKEPNSPKFKSSDFNSFKVPFIVITTFKQIKAIAAVH